LYDLRDFVLIAQLRVEVQIEFPRLMIVSEIPGLSRTRRSEPQLGLPYYDSQSEFSDIGQK